MPSDDRLSRVFGALADPTRREILARLADGDATVTELAQPFSISLPAISRHLKVLERAGLISRSRSGQCRSSSLDAAPLREAALWVERYRVFWNASLDRLELHLREVQADLASGASDAAGSPAAGDAQPDPRRAGQKVRLDNGEEHSNDNRRQARDQPHAHLRRPPGTGVPGIR